MINHAKKIFIVGAQRCGTSYLYDIFKRNKNVCVSKPKTPEPKYWMKKKTSLDTYYKKYFFHYKNEKFICEKSTSYIESTNAAKNIKKFFPNSKIVVVLRNPTDRAISNYFFSVNNKLERRNIRDAFINKKKLKLNYTTSVSPFHYIQRGFYIRYLRKYYKIFGKKNIHVVILEKLINQKKNGIKRLFKALEMKNTNIKVHFDKKINYSKKKNLTEINQIREILKKKYLKSNKLLENLIDQDLSIWKN